MDLSFAGFPTQIARFWRQIFARSGFSPQRYWESRHQNITGRIAAVGHAQLSEAQNLEQYAIKRTQIGEALTRHVPDAGGRTLLDAGCGIGLLTRLYVELGFEVTGVDFSHSAVASAQAAGINAEFKQSSLEKLSLDRRFDVVCLVDVLQHLVEDDAFTRALAAIARHVKVEGVMLVVDSLGDSGPSATHCHRRSLAWHEVEFRIVGLELIEHRQFVLPHENSIKDLLLLKRRF